MTAELVVAMTIWAEARGEEPVGREAVASVIYWRAKGKPEKMEKVCKSPRQFSCWNYGSLERLQAVGESFDHSLALSRELLGGQFTPTLRATHYHQWKINPRWARSLQFVARVGNHKFYRK